MLAQGHGYPAAKRHLLVISKGTWFILIFPCAVESIQHAYSCEVQFVRAAARAAPVLALLRLTPLLFGRIGIH